MTLQNKKGECRLFMRLHMQADSLLSLYLECCKEQKGAPGSKGMWRKYGRNRLQLTQELSVLNSKFPFLPRGPKHLPTRYGRKILQDYRFVNFRRTLHGWILQADRNRGKNSWSRAGSAPDIGRKRWKSDTKISRLVNQPPPTYPPRNKALLRAY